MSRLASACMSCCVLAGCAAAAAQTASAPAPRVVKLRHLRVDLDKQQIVFDANVCLRSGWLEQLVCRENSKEHESILNTKVRGADLHAAMLLLGLRRGKPGEVVGGHEGQPARFLPPRGPTLKLVLRWKTRDGRTRQADPGSWLKPPEGRKEAPFPKEWVFVGSESLPNGAYWADEKEVGRIISLANFGSAVIDVPFQSSDTSGLQEFVANPAAIPPKGTPVEVVLTPLPGARNAPHARAMLEIDRLGRLRLDGRPMTYEKLGAWAEAYVKRHPNGRVLLRARPRSLAENIERARRELHFSGVRDIPIQRLLSEDGLLPRTGPQAHKALAKRREDLADPKWVVPDPIEATRREILRIQRERAELQRLDTLWAEYQAHLQAELDKHPAATQPAETPDNTKPDARPE